MIRKVPLNHSLNKMLPFSLTQVPKDAMLPAQGHWAASGFIVMEGSVHVHQHGDLLHGIMGGTSGVTISWQCWEAVKGGLPCCTKPKGSACFIQHQVKAFHLVPCLAQVHSLYSFL